MATKIRATLEDLYAVDAKAEIVNGELVIMGATGMMPGRAGLEIAFSLKLHEQQHGGGYALPDNVGFVVNLPNRESFSPDAAWIIGRVDSMKFAQGAPDFAVEVRSENDYGPAKDTSLLDKIRDYIAAGTQVVWDVDLLGPDTIKKYTASTLATPAIFRRGDIADAEPIVSGWRFPVDQLFS